MNKLLNIEDLIARGENQNCEFKILWKDEYLKHIAAFANTNDGNLFIGISDTKEIVGVDDFHKLMEIIPNKSIQFLNYNIDLEHIILHNKNIILVKVKKSLEPISFRSKFYVRNGSTVQELKGKLLRDFILKKENQTWDDIAIPDFTYKLINKELINKFISYSTSNKDIDKSATTQDTLRILDNLNLLNNKQELKRAAVLLFFDNPSKYIKSAVAKIGRFKDNEYELITQDTINCNLIDMPEKILDVLKVKYLTTELSYEGIKRNEALIYPEIVLRELIVNSIVHRDYSEQSEITIKVFDDRIVFWNSGKLIFPLTIEMLKIPHPSKKRNPLLADIYFRLGYIESWGRGTLLINEEMKKHGLPEPIIEEFADGLMITLFKRKSSVKSSVKGSVKSSVKILYLLKDNPDLTISELSEELNISARAIEKQIAKLKKDNKIKRVGSSRSGYWVVK